MQPSSAILRTIESVLSIEVKSTTKLSSADTGDCFRLSTSDHSYFVKIHRGSLGGSILSAEIEGLDEIDATGTVEVPEERTLLQSPDETALVMRYYKPSQPAPMEWKTFGRRLAALHRTRNPTFGWKRDNFIGSLAQDNSPQKKWGLFYVHQRIAPQIRLAFDQKLLSKTEIALGEQFCQLAGSIFPEEPPALCHGDLWRGNVIGASGRGCLLIDPSIHYGHRELDLAMSLLFSGFPNDFYKSYDAAYPLEKGWKERVKFGQLYYLLVHLNLFGVAYKRQVMNILETLK